MDKPVKKKGKYMVKRVSIVLGVLVMLFIVGCSKPPEAEMSAATTAMDAAKAAEADQYAPDAYRMAQDTLQAAQEAKVEQDGKFALFRKYGKSKEMFVSAKSLADKAAADAAAETERVRQEVMAMMTDVQAALDQADQALKKAPRGKGSAPDIELMKNDLLNATNVFTEAKADFDAGKFLVARTKLEAAKNQAMKVVADVEAAKAKKAGK
jgi:hypothetical protein